MVRKNFILLLLALAAWLPAGQSWAAVTVETLVEKQEVYVGEPFGVQISVQGNDAPTAPNLSGIKEFQVQERGGQQNNSESVTIINGHMQRESRHGYVFTYQFTARQPGTLTIPPIQVQAGPDRLTTQPVAIRAKVPEESNDFKLRLQLEKEQAYVGEPVALTVTWYIGKEVKGFEFQLPLLTDPTFEVVDAEPQAIPAGHQDEFLRIPLGQGETLAQKGRGRLDGRDFLTMSFKKVLIPRVAGELRLPQATVAGQALTISRRSPHRDPFADLFGGDPFARQNSYETVITPSNTPQLSVRSLPAQGKPAAFNGLVGNYRIVASATPTEVQVGDPITLTIQVSGPYLKRVELPPLGEQLAPADFKVPPEMAPGEANEVLKTFTQTIRATHAGVKAIPPLTLAFFNPESGRYETTNSDPIPLTVKGARQLTVQDVQGVATPAAKRGLGSAEAGLAYNYEDPELLTGEELPALWRLTRPRLLFLAGPPILFFLLLLRKRFQSWRGAGRHDQSKSAYREFKKSLTNLAGQGDSGAGVESALQLYLGRKLKMAPGALTYPDVAARLRSRVSAEVLARLAAIMAQCEAERYAGNGRSTGNPHLRAEAEAVVAELEEGLG